MHAVPHLQQTKIGSINNERTLIAESFSFNSVSDCAETTNKNFEVILQNFGTILERSLLLYKRISIICRRIKCFFDCSGTKPAIQV